jgi:ABC-type uncharacterized transport system substrate-binding protein
MRRVAASSILVATLALVFGVAADAQQPGKIPRIGFVAQRTSPTAAVPDPGADGFKQGLRDLGYIDGKNILIDFRYGEGHEDRLPGMVAELIQLNVNVLVSTNSTALRAAKQASKSIPVVMVTTVDPVSAGLVDSLARPGGNVTGLTRLTRELGGKRLELLKEVVPKVSKVGVLWDSESRRFKDYETAARPLNIQLQTFEVRTPNPDFEGAFRAAVDGRVNALITVSGGLTLSYPKRIAELAIKTRLPSMHERIEFVEAGGLVSYSTNDTEIFRRAASYVDKILKGTKPADLPIEQPKKFELVINLKTAKQIGLTIPPNVLARADRVIR